MEWMIDYDAHRGSCSIWNGTGPYVAYQNWSRLTYGYYPCTFYPSIFIIHFLCFCDGVLCEWVELSTSNFKDLLRQIFNRNNNLCRNYLDCLIYVQTPKLMGI